MTSLASSTFLLYCQPLNEINRFKPPVFGHLLAAMVGFAAALVLPIPYASSAASITVSVILMSLPGIVYPPAVSTSLIFSYRPHDASAVATFMLTLVVGVVPAALYILLHRGIKPSRWADQFGLTDEQE